MGDDPCDDAPETTDAKASKSEVVSVTSFDLSSASKTGSSWQRFNREEDVCKEIPAAGQADKAVGQAVFSSSHAFGPLPSCPGSRWLRTGTQPDS
eukprot:g23911.t1